MAGIDTGTTAPHPRRWPRLATVCCLFLVLTGLAGCDIPFPPEFPPRPSEERNTEGPGGREQPLARQQKSGGDIFRRLRYERDQETEADHIGIFLMTFAGYDPHQAVVFWQRMHDMTASKGRRPEILSDHPSDETRIEQMRQWVP